MSKRRTVIALSLFSLLALLTAACSKEGGNTIKIGFLGDLSGSNAGIVQPGYQAAQLAVKLVNQNGKLPKKLELVPEDNKDGNPDTAAALAQRLISDDSVVGVIGPAFSGETKVTGALFRDAGLTDITQSATNPDLTKNGWKTFFRALANDNVQGGQTGELIVKVLGKKTVAVINDKSEYGAGLSKTVVASIKAAGGSVVVDQGIEPTTDYSSIIDAVTKAKPDVLYYAGYEAQAPLVAKQYRDKGGKALIMGGDGDKGSNFLKEGGSAVDGAVLTCPCLDAAASTDFPAKQFTAAFKKEFKADPGIYAAEAWDVASIFVAAIKAGGDNVTRKSVLDFVTNLKDFKGLTKTFNWTPQHEVVNGNVTFAYEVKGGKYTLLGRIDELVKKKAA